ncbi:MAG: 4-hydroxybenzoate octaprenyltransferase [Gammaproteobacteria bacterium]
MKNKYLRLMRFDKPAGIALLWAPTAWALWLANQGHPAWGIVAYFLFGTIGMRAAGCIINDLADRNIDKHVRRTHLRPLTSGEVSVSQAFVVLGLLLLGLGWIALQLPKLCWYEAVAALLIATIYPFAKRFIQAPQLLLGVAFSMGIPMAYAAAQIPINQTMIILFLLNFCWIVAYDTMYALVDKEDDLKIGVRSTAILFGSKVIPIVLLLLSLSHGLWLILSLFYPFSQWFWACWVLGGLLLVYQYTLLSKQSPSEEMRAFLYNAVYGLILWFGIC